MFEQFLSHYLLEPHYLRWLWSGFLITLLISFWTIVIATLMSFALSAARDSVFAPLRWLATAYTSLFRNTPLLVQLFFWYFASGEILPQSVMMWLNTPHEVSFLGLTLSWPSFEFLAGIVGLTFYSTPFIAEELRAGIQGVKQGQKYAALALGLTPWQSMRYVILPQAFRIALPPLLGQYMNVIKNSSLTMAIGVAELSYASRQVETESLRTFEAFGVATILYIAAIALMEAWGQWHQQRKLAQGY
ncbi:amino acid ABC transporter permease [Proteus cibi]|uniref:Amino acid ABC transporter permease n=1 Tax=Proteus cibi TaxID=2050966 RepID=A0ABU6EFJ8_9GAMM|nr:amino acid ABC transporter permease [Proteus cibi]MEB6857847.1 amino acid ABC transporter permease [Proteus cibi]MEB7089376.1 amino acid ABC transporter permease [Proteus cibi]